VTGRREDLLRREAEGRDRIAGLLDGLSTGQLERPGLTPEGWSIRDLLWHLAVWSEDAARVLREMRAGTWDGSDPSLEPGRTDAVNDEELARSRTMGIGEARAAWVNGRRDMLEAFGALEHVTPQADEWFEESGSTHYAGHLPGLAGWIGRLRLEA